jgi:ribosomal protein L22
MSAEDEMERDTPPDAPDEKPADTTVAGTPAESTAAEAPEAKPAAETSEAKPAAETSEAKPAAETSEAKPAAKGAAAKKSGEAEPAAARPRARKKPSRAKATAAAEAPAEKQRRRTPLLRKEAAKRTPSRRVVRAQARYVRTSARKARMVCRHLRGKSVHEARAILAFTPRDVARDWSKLLESAVANAETNHELLEDDLVVREAYADEGPTIKRVRPRAMGRATPIRKRTSHLTITLTPELQSRTTKR